MKYALLLCLLLAAIGCATTPADVSAAAGGQFTQTATAAADIVLSKIAPGLISTNEAANAARDAAEKIVADRLARGDPAESPLSTREWVEILGALGLGFFGINMARDRKYVKVPKASSLPIAGTVLEAKT